MFNATKRILLINLVLILMCGFIVGCDQNTPQHENTNIVIDNIDPVKCADIERAKIEYEKLLNELESFPIEFYYGSDHYIGFNNDFTEQSRTVYEEKEKISVKIVLSHKDNILNINIDTAIYPAYGAYEYTIYFTNKSEKDKTKQIKEPVTKMIFEGDSPVLKGINGDIGGNYAPYTEYLSLASVKKVCTTGRPTHEVFPYFNLEHGNNGTFIAIGWPGCWQANFELDFQSGIEKTVFTGGLNSLDTYLNPQETVRTPLMTFVCYKGKDEGQAMNLWRQWFIDCNIRKIKGETFTPQLSGATSWIYGEMTRATDDNQINSIKKYVDNDIPITYWWMDAGWYTGPDGTELKNGWPDTGAWTVDMKRFPSGLKNISNYAQSNGIGTMLWFEPEVVRVDTKLMEKEGVKQDWYVGTVAEGSWLEGKLFNLGNEEARAWLVERVSGVLRNGNITLYRQDFNVDPAGAWYAADGENRVGYTENDYVQGYLAYWDKLIELFPDMMIDSCSQGGGRNDLETMRRSIPVHKTDFDYGNYTIKQSMHMSLFNWIPYFGTPCVGGSSDLITVDTYGMRSGYCAWFSLHFNIRDTRLDWTAIKERANEWEYVSKLLYSDYYPITKWSDTATDWRGWEFYDSETGKGVLQLFRPENASESEIVCKLYGLEPEATYRLKDADSGLTVEVSGASLMNDGYKVTLNEVRSSAFVYMEKIQ